MVSRLKTPPKEETHIIADPDEVELTEFEAGVIRGIEDYKAGRGTICHTRKEALEHLESL